MSFDILGKNKNTYLHFNEVELDYDSRKKILPLLKTKLPNEPEMTEFESAFLCGLIKKFRPVKVMEVGIAGGATSAILLSCLTDIGKYFKYYAVDYSAEFYRDKNYPSGYLGQEADEALSKKSKYEYKTYLGNVACSFRNEIGNDVDCLVLDTVHLSPGEIIDFITLLPQLKDGCIVILHDTIFSHICRYKDKYRYATTVLLASVTGEKYINTDESRKTVMPNIGAFVVDKNTRKNIADVFLSLMVTWNFNPYGKQLKEYRKCIAENYDENLLLMFNAAVFLNRNTIASKNKDYSFPFQFISDKSNVVLYGDQTIIEEFEQQLQKSTIKIIASVRTGQDLAMLGSEFNYAVIAELDQDEAEKRRNELLNNGIDSKKVLWKNYMQI